MTDTPIIHDPGFRGLIGIARRDITPPAGIYHRNWGAATHDTAEGVHRPLTLTAITFQSNADDKPLVLVAADLGWWRTKEDEWLMRGGVIEALSLPVSHVMICLSHTHAGPVTALSDRDKPGGHLIEPYLHSLRQAVIDTTMRALASRRSAVLTWRHGRCDLAVNRDLPDAATRENRLVTGFNPNVPADDTLLVGRVTDEAGRITATLVNYACHPTTLAWENRLISPDYVGAMRGVVEHHTGGAPCAYLHGAAGELAPALQYVGDPAVADGHGRRLGHAAVAVLEGMNPPATALALDRVVESGAPLAVWKRQPHAPATAFMATCLDVTLPVKPMPTAAEIEEQWRQTDDRVMKERLWRKRNVRRSVGDGDAATVPVWLWRLGDALLIGHPNEAYSMLQTALRRRFPDQAVAVMNVVNGHTGYLPPRELYDRDCYTVWQTPFERGSLEALIDACAKGATRLSG